MHTIESISQKIMPIAKKYNISDVYLFGSYARNEANIKSDVDIAVDSSSIKGLLQLISFKNDVSDALGLPVDVLTLRAIEQERNNPIKRAFFENFINERIRLSYDRH